MMTSILLRLSQILLVILLVACKSEETDLSATIASQETKMARMADETLGSDSERESIVTSASSTPSTSSTEPSLSPTEIASLAPPNVIVVPVRTTGNTAEGPSDCQNDEWKLLPTDVQSVPAGDGFKHVIISLSVANRSSYWGTARFPSGQAVLVTEGGFTYSVEPDTAVEIELEDGTTRLVRSHGPASPGLLPPDYTVRGDRRGTYQWIFKVAESQDQYTLSAALDLNCFYADGTKLSFNNSSYRRSVDVLNQLTQPIYPTERADSSFPSVTDPIAIPEKGTLQFAWAERSENGKDLSFNFTFTNASEGYETNGYLFGYLLGDTGIARPEHFGILYSVGPAQTEEIEFIFEDVPVSERNFKFLLVSKDGANNVVERWAVYDIPKGGELVQPEIATIWAAKDFIEAVLADSTEGVNRYYHSQHSLPQGESEERVDSTLGSLIAYSPLDIAQLWSCFDQVPFEELQFRTQEVPNSEPLPESLWRVTLSDPEGTEPVFTTSDGGRRSIIFQMGLRYHKRPFIRAVAASGCGEMGPEGYWTVHLVAPGDYLGRISQQYGVSVSDLVAFNCLVLSQSEYDG